MWLVYPASVTRLQDMSLRRHQVQLEVTGPQNYTLSLWGAQTQSGHPHPRRHTLSLVALGSVALGLVALGLVARVVEE